MTTAENIRRLGDDIDSIIYHKRNYDDKEHVWYVCLKHVKRTGKVKLEIEATAEHRYLNEAIALAWEKFQAALGELKPISLQPAIENHEMLQIEQPPSREELDKQAKTIRDQLDDEIPF